MRGSASKRATGARPEEGVATRAKVVSAANAKSRAKWEEIPKIGLWLMHGDARQTGPRANTGRMPAPARADGHATCTLPCYRREPNGELAAELTFGRSEWVRHGEV